MTHSILPIAEEHIPSFHAAVDTVARERSYLAFLEAPPLDDTKIFVGKNIANGVPQFVALYDGRVIGWSDVLPNTSRPIFRHSGALGIGLLPEYRGRGIGQTLMQRVIDAAFLIGLKRIDLTVREGNIVAIALYKKFGFEVEGLHRNAVCIDGRCENTLSMALLAE